MENNYTATGTRYFPGNCKNSLPTVIALRSGETIIKVVNVSHIDRKVTMDILNSDAAKGTVYTLEGFDLEAVNDFEHPEYVVPVQKEMEIKATGFDYEFKKDN